MKNFRRIKRIILFQKTCAHLLSALLHPLLMPTILFGTISLYAPIALTPLHTMSEKKNFVWVIFLSTFCLPFLLLSMYMTIRYKHINVKHFFMNDNKERVFPFLTTATFYSFVVYFMKKSSAFNDIVLLIMILITLSIILIALISHYWKISAHSLSITGTISLLFFIHKTTPDSALYYPIIVMIVIAGLLMSARMYLNAHNLAQVCAGALTGLSLGIVAHLLS
ncbi:MAG: phosphatase PAP2 family protein [Cytophagaceae bacterium]|nr:phosphatase PAP2 family protein [Cytophagaceae bacterium]MDW8455968.1 phosphatase PAP2 family protein [Cytophagaceae bacterium]